jgi:hypothetical protein
MAQAQPTFVASTPIRTGNARNNTRAVGKQIRADYQYAEPLDKKNNMVAKTIAYIRSNIRTILGR